MMNWIFGIMIASGLLLCALNGNGSVALDALMNGCGGAVTLIIELAGAYMLWSGLMKIAEKAGLIDKLAGIMRRPLTLLMPDCGEAAAPIALNLAANFFGLGNAATPFGIEAMRRLDKGDGRASNAMVTFIALNASAIELLPTGVIAVRTACGSAAPYDIVLPTFIASLASAAAAAACCKLAERFAG